MSLQRILARGKANKDKPKEEQYKKEDITMRFMRSIATPITEVIYPIDFITPNLVTWLGFIIIIIGVGILLIAETNVFLLFLVGFCYWLSALFDCVDGQLARMRKSTTKNGAWLDSVLEGTKGTPFLFALAFHIQDTNGLFTLKLGTIHLLTINIWFLLCITISMTFWITMMAAWGNIIMREPRMVSQGHVYIVWIFLIFNLLDWFLVLYTVGAVLVVVYTLFEKTFLTFTISEIDSEDIKYES